MVIGRTQSWRKSIHMLAVLGQPLGILLVGWLGTLSTLLFVLVHVLVAALFLRRGIHLPFAGMFLRRASRSPG